MRRIVVLLALVPILAGGLVSAQQLDTIKLLAPALAQDIPVMQALKERASARDFDPGELNLQDLSNLLWCANGINRPESGKRTSPSAMNKQDIEVYAVLAKGIYHYDAAKHVLNPVVSGDYRKDTGMQPYVGEAPLNLIYVSDLSKFDFIKEPEGPLMTGAIDAGHCSQNVYLYCAAANLATVIRTSVDREKMATILSLPPKSFVIAAQTVGYPK